MSSHPRRALAASLVGVAGVVAVCASVVAAVPALAGTSQGAGSPSPAWLTLLNQVRVASGVSAVTENSSWTTGISHHLTYLEDTPASLRTGQYASDHTENPASAYYTSDGAVEGSRSNLVKHASQTATSAVEYWLGAPFHAIGMLRAGLSQTALAQDSTYAGMDVISGLSSSVHSTTPVLFPGPGSTDDLTSYAGNESPDPIETCRAAYPTADYSAPGLPIIAMLPAAPATSLTASLTTPGGSTLTSSGPDLCVVDENTYVSSDLVYGPTGLQILTGDHAVLVIPRTPLVAGTYAVRISQAKQADISWSFTVSPAGSSSAPTSSAPTSSAPTSSAPTTSAPTTTAPTSSAPTSAPASSPTFSSSAASPVALPPVVTATPVACSYGNRSNGQVRVSVRNPADGAGAAAYSIALGPRVGRTASVADGSGTSAVLTGLPPGPSSGSVTGSDGTGAAFGARVATCPAYQGVRVDVRRTHPRWMRITLDNTRNAVGTTFRVDVGGRVTRHLVPAGGTLRLGSRLARPVQVSVHVGRHSVAQARLAP